MILFLMLVYKTIKVVFKKIVSDVTSILQDRDPLVSEYTVLSGRRDARITLPYFRTSKFLYTC